MEDLPLGKIATLVTVCSEGPALGQNTDDVLQLRKKLQQKNRRSNPDTLIEWS